MKTCTERGTEMCAHDRRSEARREARGRKSVGEEAEMKVATKCTQCTGKGCVDGVYKCNNKNQAKKKTAKLRHNWKGKKRKRKQMRGGSVNRRRQKKIVKREKTDKPSYGSNFSSLLSPIGFSFCSCCCSLLYRGLAEMLTRHCTHAHTYILSKKLKLERGEKNKGIYTDHKCEVKN